MTTKQELFVIEYLKDFNATQAAIRAGYSEDTAYSQGQRLLKNVEIQKIKEERVSEIIGDSTQDIIENHRFWRAMRDNVEAPEAARIKASEMLAKYRGQFTEKIEISGGMKIDTEFKIVDADT